MNTLKEIGNFVGIPQGSLKHLDQYEDADQNAIRTIQLSLVASAVRWESSSVSMLGIIQVLRNLTPITLEAKIVPITMAGNVSVTISWNASGGIIWFTFIEYRHNGGALRDAVFESVGSSAGEITHGLSAGKWEYVVTRAGISNTGFVYLSKTLPTVTVPARPEPTPEPLPEPTPEKPFIAVETRGDGSFVVSGSNFSPNARVYIHVVDANLKRVVFHDTSNPEGKLEGFQTGRICTQPGTLVFSANDGRRNRADVTGTLWSNSVTTSCPVL